VVGKSAEAEPTTTDGRHADLATGATTGTETALAEALAEVLAEVVRSERVPADSHFFDDLGADSLVMAHFCARVRKRPDLPDVSIRDVYRNPTIRGLVAALKDVSPGGAAPPPVQLSEMPAPASTRLFVLCGALQFTIFVGYSYLVAVVLTHGYQWISEASGVVDIYLRSVVFSGAAFVGLCTFPVGAKWILVGRWKAGEFPLWGLAYLRFWTVKALVHANPMVFFVGNPLFVWYLRALGARVGRNVTILSRAIPVCTDLLTIGSGAVIRKETHLLCYRAHAGRIQTGPVTLGRDVFVGERSILDINTSMGDGAQLGHASALQSGESVPAGQHWHGSPAQRTDLDYVRVGPARCGTLRRAGFALGALLQVFLVYLPLAVGATYLLVALVPALGQLLDAAPTEIASGEMFGTALALSLVLFLGPLLGGLAVVFTVPRVLNLLIKPDKVYPLYGFHYGVHRAIVRLTNVKFYKKLFGDSSYIVPYLRLLGYDLSQVQQTGSNFGSELQHESPYLSTIGSGTMVCDGLSMMNAEFSNTSFRVSRVTIGPGNFLGNNIAFPAGARTGADCLLATKVLIPLDGKVREGVGLLGSPSFEIPRSVERDGRFDHLRTGDELRRNLRAKNRYNRRTMGVFLLAHWLQSFVITVFGLVVVDLYDTFGALTLTALSVVSLLFTAVYFALVERAFVSFRSLRPLFCSMYEPH
jgi:non-ribosomal peptide synthetase-like protein